MAIWYVDDDAVAGGIGSRARPFDEIKDVTRVLNNWDIIRLAEGRYGGGHTITERGIEIIGEGSQTIIEGGRLYGLRVTGDDFEMSGVHIMRSGDAGFQAMENEGITLRDCWFRLNQGPGVSLIRGDHYVIQNNIMSHNGTTTLVPGETPNGVGLSVLTPRSSSPGNDGTVHILIEGNAFHHNQGTVRSKENHGAILDFYTQADANGVRYANPFNYKQDIVVRYNDSFQNGKHGYLVHHADQRGLVNPDFITFLENRAWNNGQDNIPGTAEFRINVSEGVKLVRNLAFDNGEHGDDHFSFHAGSSTVRMVDNHGNSGLSNQNSTIIGRGNVFNTPLDSDEWRDYGRAHWLELISTDEESTGVAESTLDW